MNLNYKPENKDKDSSEILLEYIKNDYWYKQGHKSKNYILSNEIISEYFKKKDYIGLQRKISEYVQQYDIKKACEQYFVTIEEDFRYPFVQKRVYHPLGKTYDITQFFHSQHFFKQWEPVERFFKNGVQS